MKKIFLIVGLLIVVPLLAFADKNEEEHTIDAGFRWAEKIGDSIPPELKYSEATDSMVKEFIELYNKNDSKTLYETSDNLLKDDISYEEFQDAMSGLKFIYGNIKGFSKITREEQLANDMISMLSEAGRKLPNGKYCKFCLYKIQCDKLSYDGLLELTYTKANKIVGVHIRAKVTDEVTGRIKRVHEITDFQVDD